MSKDPRRVPVMVQCHPGRVSVKEALDWPLSMSVGELFYSYCGQRHSLDREI